MDSLISRVVSAVNKHPRRIKDVVLPDKLTEYLSNLPQDQSVSSITHHLQKYYDLHFKLAIVNNSPSLSKPFVIRKNKSQLYIKTTAITGDKSPKNKQRVDKIIKATSTALVAKPYESITIDLHGNAGGDFDAFLNAVKPLIPAGLLFYNKFYYYYYKGNKAVKSKKYVARKVKPDDRSITILVDKGTASSAEFLVVILLALYPSAKIQGEQHDGRYTSGCLSTTEQINFTYGGVKYQITMGIGDGKIYDFNGKEYPSYI